MKFQLQLIVGVFLALVSVPMAQSPPKKEESSTKFQTRCGWFQNPTPANIWFYDREGEWVIGTQGGYQTPGDWPWPAFKPKQWVRTNGNYGYGCACLRMRVSKSSRHVLEISSAQARPLSSCRQDANLKKLENTRN